MEEKLKFYDQATGKIITDFVLNAIANHDTTALKGVKIGICPKTAVIVDGYIQNPPSNGTAYHWDPLAHSIKKLEPDPRFIKQDPLVPEVTAREIGAEDALLNPDLAVDLILDEERKRRDAEFARETDKALEIFKPVGKTPAKSVEEVFKYPKLNTPVQKQEAYRRAGAKSKPPVKQSHERNRNNRKTFNSRIIATLLAIILTLLFELGVIHTVNEIDAHIDTNTVQKAVSQLLVPPNAEKTPGIVNRNTHRTEDFQNFWYDNAGIANDILKLPDEAFDAILYSVYDDMGTNRSNSYIDNFSRVIAALGTSATPENNPLAYARCAGCDTFEEFCIKNGYVDSLGNPSTEMYVDQGKKAVDAYNAYLESMAASRNAAAIEAELATAELETTELENEAPGFGGRN